MHWISWDQLKVDKLEGGMGFKDLRSFNIAMLAKQAWRLLLYPDTLLGKILRHKYYKDGSILSAKSTNRISFAFRSILAGRDLLQEGLMFRLGNGRSINPFYDKWIPRPTSYSLITPAPESCSLRVSDFILDGEWNVELLRTHFWEIDVDLIRNMPIDSVEREDEIFWLHSDTGSYTVSSGYRLHRSLEFQLPEPSSGLNRGWLRNIWHLKIPKKVSTTVWRIWKESLPVATRVRHRGLPVPISCSLCNESAESDSHLFVQCPVTIDIWNSVLPSDCRRSEMSSAREWIEHIFRTELLPVRQSWAIAAWVIWYCRNQTRFKGETFSTGAMVSKIFHYINFFTQAPITRGVVEEDPTRSLTWSKPPEGWVKVNCDAALKLISQEAGTGCVLRDETGAFVAASCSKATFSPSVLVLEMEAIKEGICLARDAECKKVIVESDSLKAIQLLQGKHTSSVDSDIRGVLKSSLDFCRGFSPWFEDLIFSHVGRTGNQVAHIFAQNSLVLDSPSLFTEKPVWANALLAADIEPVGF